MSLQVSEPYAQLLDKARWSHAHGRSVFHILQSEVDAARLFSYGYRSQAIGTFHATRVALEAEENMADHGFANNSGHDHVVPFVFGSLTMTGWGIFFDVEPRSDTGIERREHPLESPELNHSIFMERALQRALNPATVSREVLIPAKRAGSREIGGMELTVGRVRAITDLSSDHYRTVSVQSGRGRVRIGAAQKDVSAHDHFGVPAGLECTLTELGGDPLVFLDAIILPIS